MIGFPVRLAFAMACALRLALGTDGTARIFWEVREEVLSAELSLRGWRLLRAWRTFLGCSAQAVASRVLLVVTDRVLGRIRACFGRGYVRHIVSVLTF